MATYVFVLLCVLGQTWADTVFPSTLPPDTPSLSLSARMDRLEALFRQQQMELTHTKETQSAELSLTKAQLSDTKHELTHTREIVYQQERRLSQQGHLLSLQSAKLDRQERMLRQLQVKTTLAKENNTTVPSTMKGDRNSVMPAVNKDSTSTIPLLQKVETRSDDAGPLEVVVQHMSQQMTQMDADLQAFKTQASSDIQSLKNANHDQDLGIQEAQTSTFIRWGHSQCTNASDLIYSGVVGGSWQDHTGGATDYLCLTMSPTFSDHHVPGQVAYLYGGEYQTEDDVYQQDPVCAACRSAYTSTLMIPGTNVCTAGWHTLYSGFLMSGVHSAQSGSQYICVDSKREAIPHSIANENGKQLTYTTTRCGSLPCPPYVNNKIVTCVVCGK